MAKKNIQPAKSANMEIPPVVEPAEEEFLTEEENLNSDGPATPPPSTENTATFPQRSAPRRRSKKWWIVWAGLALVVVWVLLGRCDGPDKSTTPDKKATPAVAADTTATKKVVPAVSAVKLPTVRQMFANIDTKIGALTSAVLGNTQAMTAMSDRLNSGVKANSAEIVALKALVQSGNNAVVSNGKKLDCNAQKLDKNAAAMAEIKAMQNALMGGLSRSASAVKNDTHRTGFAGLGGKKPTSAAKAANAFLAGDSLVVLDFSDVMVDSLLVEEDLEVQ